MKLLILTQKVNSHDDVLGFMHGWIAGFAAACENVVVICLEKGEMSLPSNVTVCSLGKESGHSKIKYLCNFYKYIWRERKHYDAIFVHMNCEYVILGGLLWKLWRKRIGLWYAHGAVPLRLKIAEKLSDIIFTSTASGFRIKSRKVRVIGQGIDTDVFAPVAVKPAGEIFRIITVGRISPVKDYETLLKAAEILAKKNISFHITIIGDIGLPEQKKYLEYLRELTADKHLQDAVNFSGAVPNKNIVGYLQANDLFVNMSRTGSLDKAVVEAMACGLPILTCNEALAEVLGEYQDMLMYRQGDCRELAAKIILFINMAKAQKEKVAQAVRAIVVRDHNLKSFIAKIITMLQHI